MDGHSDENQTILHDLLRVGGNIRLEMRKNFSQQECMSLMASVASPHREPNFRPQKLFTD